MKKALFTLALTLVAFMANAQSYTYDVNKDGMVSISDVTFLVNNILGVSNVGEDEQHFVYDVNGDNVANVSDVTCLVNKILGVLNPGEDTKPYLTCPDGNHPHLIDLGLPSGTMWSCCNVGAVKPEAYGDYYAWGETVVKDYYFWSSYTHCKGSKDTCLDLGGDIAFTRNDAAHVKWGGMWGMPTSSQIEELLGNCTSERTTVNGVGGRRFTGPNGGTIFLPAAGRRVIRGISDLGNQGNYWSSNQSSDLYSAGELYFDSEEVSSKFYECHLGFTVRPIAIPLQLSTHALSLLIGRQGIVKITSGQGSYTVSSGDEAVAMAVVENSQLLVSANGQGQTVVTVTDVKSGQKVSIQVTVVVNFNCYDNHHPHMVDLGLPSGTMWSCCNVGADKPEAYGGYYAWGELEVKDNYDWRNYALCDGSIDTVKDLGENIALTDYDLAHVKWGGTWMMPSGYHFEELFNICSAELTSIDGVNGIGFKGPNGNAIFMPASGYCRYSPIDCGINVCSWSSMQMQDDLIRAMGINCYEYFGEIKLNYTDFYRSYGLPVRPVSNIVVSSSNLNIIINSQKEVTVIPDDYSVSNSNPSVVAVSKNDGSVTLSGKEEGQSTVTVTDMQSGRTAVIQVTVECLGCPDQYHPHMIDMGLPSGTKWSCCNIGSSTPEGYGEYYAWGETRCKENYTMGNYSDYDGETNTCIYFDHDLVTSRDVAYSKWGPQWRMPSAEQCRELINNCSSKWTTMNGVHGRKFIGKSGYMIFLPAAGSYGEYGLNGDGGWGFYWTTTPFPSNPNRAYNLYLSASDREVSLSLRSNGLTIRPVSNGK